MDPSKRMTFNTTQNVSTTTDSSSVIKTCFTTYVVLIPSTSYIINSVIGCVVNAILAIMGTFLNALVVYIFWKTPKLRHKISYFMIMVLSSIDLCVSIIVHPSQLLNSIAEMTGTPKCFYRMFYYSSAIIFSGMSFLTFFVMNVERYLSITHPFFHLVHVTKQKCLVASSLLWIVCIVTGIAPIFKLNIHRVITIVALIVIIGTFFIYVSIFHVARKRRSSKHRIHGHGGQDADLVVHYPQSQREPEAVHSRKTISFLHDLQLAKMYLLVVLTSIVLNSPNAVVLAAFNKKTKTLDGVVQVKVWTMTLVAMNSTMNSLIFFWSNKSLRKEGWKTCKKFFKI